jgi:hypothetical protein
MALRISSVLVPGSNRMKNMVDVERVRSGDVLGPTGDLRGAQHSHWVLGGPCCPVSVEAGRERNTGSKHPPQPVAGPRTWNHR